MATFNIKNSGDLDSVLRYIEEKANASLELVGEKVKEEVQDYIQKNLYDASSPNKYTRTMEYLNSVDVKVVDKNTVEIYFDTDKISPRDPDGEGRWSSHQNITNGVDVSDLIPEFMEYGVSGSKYDRSGIYAIENSVEIANQTKYHVHELIKQLASVGIKATIG